MIVALYARYSSDNQRVESIVAQLRACRISTHTPLAGRDEPGGHRLGKFLEFQLTRPSRGVTITTLGGNDESTISTHTPLAGRDLDSYI